MECERQGTSAPPLVGRRVRKALSWSMSRRSGVDAVRRWCPPLARRCRPRPVSALHKMLLPLQSRPHRNHVQGRSLDRLPVV